MCPAARAPRTPIESRCVPLRLSCGVLVQSALLGLRLVSTVALCCCAWAASRLYTALGGRSRPRIVPAFRRGVRIISGCLLGSFGFRLRIVGQENVPADYESTRYVLVSNHVTVYDVWAIMSTVGPVSFVSKQAIFNFPILGTVLTALEAIGVDRSKSNAAARQAIDDRVTKGIFPPCVFPEGSTTNGYGVVDFKEGAFAPGARVLPIALEYSCPSGFDLSYTSNQMSSGAVLQHFFRTLVEPYKTVTVRVLPAVEPDAAMRKDAGLYARHVRGLIASALPHQHKWDGWDSQRMRTVWFDKDVSKLD
ncbi:hypothetical protein M885DRAFT_532404 [Pelagophyceae sp. CCMP2097]|nr:hypothetical protein M885DRAFT_532404 [Pelagophyceae sp. CCMP2097]|eukprot:CAMPEP_0184262274 /NCGR_PEP_ID=MMETSP0977-20130417/15799_1 /TAXON_ID=483370 /ORGANISM="non described non described, Strain CCMP2097" /LENGTH=306 /DNA_ID=CAMNT_0026567953 /DNA_START=32 /DNA_END=952 /DNA_ORIENTATION=-